VNNPIQKILNIHKQGQPVGIVAICSANRWVLEASMLQAKSDNSYLLIESTSNQVNQYGGYTGMTPRQFKELVLEIAQVVNFPAEKLILGGDHLGPNAWKNEKSTDALAKAESLIREYLLAGFNKIHLDTSMPCADDKIVESEPLDINIVIERIADLCLIAEDTNKERGDFYPPLYVIGSEVPIPGGAQKDLTEFEPTSVEDVKITIEKTKKVFLEKGLESAWERVIAIVVQAGVEFGDSTIVEYDRSKASELSKTVMLYDNLLYEAHSTDYQTKESLKQMVEDHFAILKVGPALTFSMREALFALAEMEIKYLAGNKTVVFSFVRELIDKAMRDNPVYWKKYYH
jgi:D-tagatose-1,6-bisphosphate aldolase subunit GatZ/KbaZ